MGPPHPSWKKEVQTFRNGHPHATEQLCQLGSAWKAPKWTFGRKFSGVGGAGSAPGPAHIGNPPDSRYATDPVFSFGVPPGDPRASRSLNRTRSAPPGPDFKPPHDPTTPKWSFGTTPRPCPFGSKSAPGPYDIRGGPGGPKYSFPPGPQRGKHLHGNTPSPDYYGPLGRPGNAIGPRVGPDTVLTGDLPKKPPYGPGPNYMPPWNVNGPAYSFRPQLPALGEKPGDMPGGWTLPPQYTYFGYNEYGHCDTFDIPNIKAKLGRKDAVGPDGKPLTKADIASLRKSASMPASKFHVVKTAIDDHPIRAAMTEKLKTESAKKTATK